MDINLAGEMDGIAAADHIQSFSHVPIIYLTGHSEAPFLKKASITAPYGYLVKPVSSQELSAAIEMAFYRHALDMKLKESEERLKLALASSHMGVWERNVATNEIFWSPECHEVFGSIDFGGTFESFANLLHPEDAPRMMAAIGAGVDGPSGVSGRVPDRPSRWRGSLARRLRQRATSTPQERSLRVIGIVQDITERREAKRRFDGASNGFAASLKHPGTAFCSWTRRRAGSSGPIPPHAGSTDTRLRSFSH